MYFGMVKLVLLVFLTSILCDPPDMSGSSQDLYSPNDDAECKDASKNCSDLPYTCLTCPEYNPNMGCRYGEWKNVTCNVSQPAYPCIEPKNNFIKRARCVYCYQTEPWEHTCGSRTNCHAQQSPAQYYKTNCTVHPEVMCFGNRKFPKKLRCNWTRGHKWSTALLLSITLGGFGADRFYLGHWQEGIGKLFSFGGLGVWTLVDVLLIAIRYLGPADGSFYV